jgi:hypothetical protein
MAEIQISVTLGNGFNISYSRTAESFFNDITMKTLRGF